MGFFSRLFKLDKNAKIASIPSDVRYSNWTKEQLIERLLQFESETVTKKPIPYDLNLNQLRKRPAEGCTAFDKEDNKKSKKAREFNYSKYNTRFVALKFAYLGWNYNGLAVQKGRTPLPTVEGVIIEALYKCKLIPSIVPQDFKFSRCGRTDKGVSAMNQVISLRVRSNLPYEQQLDSEFDDKEIQYVHILNQLLPPDIRVSAVCLRPPKGFDARFSCITRHYKYLFKPKGLDIQKMKEAASYFEGEHDFRNFCKLDGSKQITNYHRRIQSAKIMVVNEEMYCFDLVGSAFLWHQVRCMMANLFLVGQGLEEPSLILDMLNIEKMPRKPIYEMASDIPLILYDCQFPPMEWTVPDMTTDRASRSSLIVNSVAMDYSLKACISGIYQNTLPKAADINKVVVNLGDGIGKVSNAYQKISDRYLMDSFETVNAKYRERKQRTSKN